MKKLSKWLAIIVGSLVGLIIVAALWMKFAGVDPEAELQAKQFETRRSEGRLLAIGVSTALEMDFIESDKYSSVSLEKFRAESEGFRYYDFGTKDSDPRIAKLCPDCVITDDSFKVAVFGTIDNDEDLDLLTIDHEKNLILVHDDLGLTETPKKL
jgi:hypothetical protein